MLYFYFNAQYFVKKLACGQKELEIEPLTLCFVIDRSTS